METTFVSGDKITKAQQIIDIIAPIPADKFVSELFVEYDYKREGIEAKQVGHAL